VNREREEKERVYSICRCCYPPSSTVALAPPGSASPAVVSRKCAALLVAQGAVGGGVVLIQMWSLKIISNRVRCGASVGGLSKRNAIATDAGWLRSTSRTRREECRLGVSQLQRPCSEQKYRWAGEGWAPRNAGAHKAPPMQLKHELAAMQRGAHSARRI
jgi:hypothetical protein